MSVGAEAPAAKLGHVLDRSDMPTSSTLRAWNLVGARETGGRGLLEAMVAHAVLAPSSHNTQPWRFRIDAGTVELWADRSRRLPVVDSDDRALTISCGCALYHLRLAARSLGRRVSVELEPNPLTPDLLARVWIDGHEDPSAQEQELAGTIPRRHTNRQPFDHRPVPAVVQEALPRLAASEGAWLVVLDSVRQRMALGELVAAGDREQMSDRRFRRELAQWVVPNRSGRGDGIPGYAFAFSDPVSLLAPVAIRWMPLARSQAAKDRSLAVDAPALCVLGTDEDTPKAWLAAGQAHAKVSLAVRAAGLWTSYLNQPIEVSALRPQVSSVARGGAFSQLLTRIGFGPDARPTPRRPAHLVIDDPRSLGAEDSVG